MRRNNKRQRPLNRCGQFVSTVMPSRCKVLLLLMRRNVKIKSANILLEIMLLFVGTREDKVDAKIGV